MLAWAELGRAEIWWLLTEIPCRAEEGVPGGPQQLQERRGSPRPHRAGGAHGGLSSRQGAAEPTAHTSTGAGLCPARGSSCPSRVARAPQGMGVPLGIPKLDAPCQAREVWGWLAPVLGTCVEGRAQAGVVGGTRNAGAPVLAAVVLAGVAGRAAAQALEARRAQAPVRKGAFRGGSPKNTTTGSLQGSIHACREARGSGVWCPPAEHRRRGGCQGAAPCRAHGEDAELPRQRAERPLGVGGGGPDGGAAHRLAPCLPSVFSS